MYFLLLSTLFLCIHPILQTQCQMIPISEVRTHPPEEVKRKVTVDPNAKVKSEVHAKIASAHTKEEYSIQSAESHDEDDLSKSAKVFRKDKSPEFQNPEKHASESWLLHFLIERYIQNSMSDSASIIAEQVDILQNLEHFAHKYENGRDLFGTTNALADILLPALNSSHAEIRMGSCSVFAVAAQNNLIVQSKSFDAGVLRPLVHLLSSDTSPVKAKALYAISSLTRNFPIAQQKFIQDGGILALIHVAFLPETRKRSLTLVTDFLNERRECDEEKFRRIRITKNGHNNEEDLLEVPEDPCDRNGLLANSLRANGWCNVLEDSVKNIAGFGDDEQILIVDAVTPSLEICGQEMRNLSKHFEQLLVKFEADEDYGEIVVRPLRDILTKLDSEKLSFSRTEL